MYCCCKLVVILLFLFRTVFNFFRKFCIFFNFVFKLLLKVLKKGKLENKFVLKENEENFGY